MQFTDTYAIDSIKYYVSRCSARSSKLRAGLGPSKLGWLRIKSKSRFKEEVFSTRICHVWERFWPLEIGGLERYIIGLSHFLWHNDPQMCFLLITGRMKLALLGKRIKKYEDAGWLKVYRLGPNIVGVIDNVFLNTLHSRLKTLENMSLTALYHEAVRWDQMREVDVFHVHGIWGDLQYAKMGVLLSRHFEKPLVISLHGSFVGSPENGGMPLESPEIRKILATDAGAIITYSPEVLGTLKKMGFERKSHYIPNFVDTASFSRRGIPCQRKGTRIVSVSRLVTGLDQDIIIRAFGRVHAIIPQATLQIVGYGEMYEPLKRLVTQLKLSGQVSFVGRQTDVRSFLWNSDIFVATNFGYMATLEAWAAGLAVIAPDFGIMKDIIVDGENGILVPPNDPGKLAIAIVRLLKDSKLRETIASNGEKAAEEYDIREVASRIARIYDSLRSS